MTELLSAPLWMTLIVFCGFLFHWTSVLLEWNRIKPFAKALAMILVIVWTLSSVNFEVNYYIAALLFAQIFGLFGDILLLFPGKWFVWGLGAFLVGHLFYLGLLGVLLLTAWKQGALAGFPLWITIVVFALWISYLITFTRFLSPYVYKKRSDLPFWSAAVIYGAILSFIVIFSVFLVSYIAAFSWIQLCLPVGAALFFISDNILAYDRFVRKVRNGRLWVIVTYHLGQFNLAIGFLYLIGLFDKLPV